MYTYLCIARKDLEQVTTVEEIRKLLLLENDIVPCLVWVREDARIAVEKAINRGAVKREDADEVIESLMNNFESEIVNILVADEMQNHIDDYLETREVEKCQQK